MGLKCSVFGHDYADYDVERERADHGQEVVTTVRTTEICRTCGEARIVSENTEIAAAAATTADDDGSRDGNGGDDSDASTPLGERSGRIDDTASADHGGQIGGSDDRSVGPTTAHATSRSLAESELRCPACAFSERVLGSALRAGDSCPQCSRGYLARRTRKE